MAPMRATHEDENGSRPRGSGLVPLVRAVDSRLRGDDGWAASCRCLGSSFIAIARGLGGGHARTSMKVRYADLLGRDLPNTLGPGSPPSRGCGGGCLLVQAEDEWPPEPDVLLGSGRPFDCVRGATRTSSYSAQQLSFGVKRWQWLGPNGDGLGPWHSGWSAACAYRPKGYLLWLPHITQSLVEGLQGRVISGCLQGCHAHGSPEGFPPTPHSSLATEGATVPIEGCNPRQGSDLPTVQSPQFLQTG